MKDLKDFLVESLVAESKITKNQLTDAIKALDEEGEGQDMVAILRGNNFNPIYLKAATSKGWENLGVDPNNPSITNSEKTIWSRILSDITVKKIDDVVKWLEDNKDDIEYELSDISDPFSVAMDVFPVIYKDEI